MLAERTEPKPVFSSEPLPAYELDPVIQLSDLINFFKHPVRGYLRTRIGFSPFWTPDVDEEDIPITVDGLAAWKIGDRMLRRQLTGISRQQLVDAEWRRGDVPPRQLGSRVLDPIARTVEEIAERVAPLTDGEPSNVDVLAEVGAPGASGTGRFTVAGTVAGVYGDRLVTFQYSKLNATHRLEAWIRLLAMTVTEPAPWQAVTVAQPGFEGGMSTLGPVPPEFAAKALADLVDLYRLGLGAPLPLPPKTAAEYAKRRRDDRAVNVILPRIRRTFELESDACYRTVFGDTASGTASDRDNDKKIDAKIIDHFLATPSIRAEERGKLAEPSRFGTLAVRFWIPLLMSEAVDR